MDDGGARRGILSIREVKKCICDLLVATCLSRAYTYVLQHLRTFAALPLTYYTRQQRTHFRFTNMGKKAAFLRPCYDLCSLNSFSLRHRSTRMNAQRPMIATAATAIKTP